MLWLVFAIFAAIVIILEIFSRFLDSRETYAGTRVLQWGTLRAIRLEEGRPGRLLHCVPTSESLDHSDGYLERHVYLYQVDGAGFLMPSRVHDDPEVTIIFQGGSTTESTLVDPELRFPFLAGRLLERAIRKRVNAYNAGVSGSFTLDSINSLLNKHVAARPTFVVMMEAINDLQTLVFNHNSYYGRARNPVQEIEQRRGRRTPDVLPSLMQLAHATVRRSVPHFSSRLMALEARLQGRLQEIDEFAVVRGEERHVDPDAILANFRRNVTLYISVARQFGITPILMTQASRFYDDSPAWRLYIKSNVEAKTGLAFDIYRRLHRSINGVTREVGETEDVLVIDLERRIPARSEFIHDPVHFNNNGSQLAAEIISEEIAQHYFGTALKVACG
jgi:lysophospholipase L1-like esterase